jgi:hypothetical protein
MCREVPTFRLHHHDFGVFVAPRRWDDVCSFLRDVVHATWRETVVRVLGVMALRTGTKPNICNDPKLTPGTLGFYFSVLAVLSPVHSTTSGLSPTGLRASHKDTSKARATISSKSLIDAISGLTPSARHRIRATESAQIRTERNECS